MNVGNGASPVNFSSVNPAYLFSRANDGTLKGEIGNINGSNATSNVYTEHTKRGSLSGELNHGVDASVSGKAFLQNPPLDHMTELVVVCGHAICTNPRNAYHGANWLLQPFQRADPSIGKPSEHETFLQHIAVGASYLRNPSTLLVFSGGKTHASSDVAEGYSYGQVLLHDRSFHGPGIREAILQRRVVAECWATDSYQNLLFSIIYFWEKVGRWPENITVVTHAFKQDRFLQCHSDALRWPRDRIKVQGINPPFKDKELQDVTQFESKCREQFERDPYGASEPLAEKRRQRRWDDSALAVVLGGISDEQVKEQLKSLLDWTGGESKREIYPGKLPWDEVLWH